MPNWFEKSTPIILWVAALLALAGSFEAFASTLLFWRLVITGVALVIVAWQLVSRLAYWVRPNDAIPGFGQRPQALSRSRLILAALALAVCYAVFAGLAWFQTARHVLTISESRTGAVSTTVISAPSRMIDMTVQLPSVATSDCGNFHDITPAGSKGISITPTDMSSPKPELEISGFVSPQVITIECRPASSLINGLFFRPPTTEAFQDSTLRICRILSYLIGGLIWLIAVWRLYSLSA